MKEIIIASIAAFPPTLMAFISWRESKRIHKTVNSRMSELLSASKAESHAEGREEGRLEVKETQS